MEKIKLTDLFIILAILLILGLFIFPPTPVMIDLFILINILSTVILLSIVIYVDSPAKVSFFPSILLILTLFRIGLTICTARIILLTGTAGSLIKDAGQVIIGHNIIVGIIMFIIIAIVNFLVITKGSERVAEVVARFTLDALPGKQMSIDADLKSGHITMEEAQERRNLLQIESSLYGALDGTTKFVKGDVISNVVIVVVNLIAGIIIGVFNRDLDLSQAVSEYSILSIGDGILQQIPITLSSLASGIIVTRINTTLTTGSIGNSIRDAIAQNRVVLVIGLAILILLLFVENISKFLIISLIIFFLSGFYLIRPRVITSYKGVKDHVTDFSAGKNITNNDLQVSNLPPIDPWKVYPIIVIMSDDLIKNKKNKVIKNVLDQVNAYIYSKLGIELPPIYMTSGNISTSSYQILINEVIVEEFLLYEDLVLVADSAIEMYAEENSLIKNEKDIGLPELGYWIDKSYFSSLELGNISYLEQDQVILEHITHCLINNINDLIGYQEVKTLLDKMVDYQDLIKELLRIIPLNKLTDIIKRLLVEKIPIRNFKVILDALLEWGNKESETILLVEYVRLSLAKYIVQMYKYNQSIYAIRLDEDLEEQISESIRYNNNGMFLELDESFYESFHSRLTEIFLPLKIKDKVIVLTKFNIRKAVSHIVNMSFNIPVLSQEELAVSETKIELIDYIY